MLYSKLNPLSEFSIDWLPVELGSRPVRTNISFFSEILYFDIFLYDNMDFKNYFIHTAQRRLATVFLFTYSAENYCLEKQFLL